MNVFIYIMTRDLQDLAFSEYLLILQSKVIVFSLFVLCVCFRVSALK